MRTAYLSRLPVQYSNFAGDCSRRWWLSLTALDWQRWWGQKTALQKEHGWDELAMELRPHRSTIPGHTPRWWSVKCWAHFHFDEKGGEHFGVDVTVWTWLVQINVVQINVFCPYSHLAGSTRDSPLLSESSGLNVSGKHCVFLDGWGDKQTVTPRVRAFLRRASTIRGLLTHTTTSCNPLP